MCIRDRPGFAESERNVGVAFENLFHQAGNKRIIIASFASNIHRIQQIVDNAARTGRKVAVSGRSMVNVVAKAIELGYLNVPKDVMIDIDNIGRYPKNKLVLVTTGSQGEPMSALSRMAAGDHRKVSVKMCIRDSIEMMCRLFDPMAAYLPGKESSAIEKSWFPIPVYFPHMDNV